MKKKKIIITIYSKNNNGKHKMLNYQIRKLNIRYSMQHILNEKLRKVFKSDN